jgi:aryl-alcohol dehydrogenase-like predicted oxidoreductase
LGLNVKYRLLGRSAMRVSEVALGTMTFGEKWGWGAALAESRRMLDRKGEDAYFAAAS